MYKKKRQKERMFEFSEPKRKVFDISLYKPKQYLMFLLYLH